MSPVEPGELINAPLLSAPEVADEAASIYKSRLQINNAPRICRQAESKTSKAIDKKHSRYIPAVVRRKVWQKSNGQCHYVDPLTGRRCGSQRFLHIDHIRAYAHGGANTPENLQLLCSSHNKWKGDRATALPS